MRHTLFEVFGLKSKSCKVWDSHFAVGLSCFAFAPSAAAFWAVSLCLFQFADLEAGRRSEGLLRDLSIPKGAGFPTWLEGTYHGFQLQNSYWDDHPGSQLQDPGVLIQLILYALLGVLYTLVVITSYLADYLFIKREQRSLYGSLA